MGNLSVGEIVTLAVGGILALSGAVTTVGSAVEKVVKAVKAAKAPEQKQNAEIEEIKTRLSNVERKLDNDKIHLDNIDAGNRVTQLALLALLDHGIDGNNIDQMQHAKEELQNHLINR